MAVVEQNFNGKAANIVFQKMLEIRNVRTVRFTAGHRPAQAQEAPAGWGRFSRFCLKSQSFFAK